MNARSAEILNRLCNGEPYQIGYLADDYNVSTRLIRYAIDEINVLLAHLGIDEVVPDRKQGIQLVINEEQRNNILSSLESFDSKVIALSAKERQIYIMIKLLTSSDYVTSQQLADILDVSKSSIDKDFQAIKSQRYNFEFMSDLGRGSYIAGNEYSIRTYFYKILEKNVDLNKKLISSGQVMSYFEKMIYDLVYNPYIDLMVNILQKLEGSQNKKLIHLSYKELIVHLTIIVLREQRGFKLELDSCYIEQTKASSYIELAENIGEEICKVFNIESNESNNSYIALLLESSSYVSVDYVQNNDWAAIQLLANSISLNVGEKLGVNFIDDIELNNALILHLGPTIYKIKNKIPVVNPSLGVIKKNYQEVFIALRETIIENEYADLRTITDDDIGYLTLHFCAAIERKKRQKAIYHIIIVCVHGYATASLMKELISLRFKNIVVKDMITQNDLQNIDLYGIDFIVSSIDLQITNCPIIRVNTLLKAQDYERIDNAMKDIEVKHTRSDDSFIDDIIKIVDKYTNIIERENLSDSLIEYFNEYGLNVPRTLRKNLYDFLPRENIIISSETMTKENAIECVGNILLLQGKIEKTYIESMKRTLNTNGSYMVVDNGIALVHGDIDSGVNDVGMSLLINERGINFDHGKFDPVHIVL